MAACVTGLCGGLCFSVSCGGLRCWPMWWLDCWPVWWPVVVTGMVEYFDDPYGRLRHWRVWLACVTNLCCGYISGLHVCSGLLDGFATMFTTAVADGGDGS